MDMIERVAFATCSSMPCICMNKHGFEGMPCLDRGRAAIAAMREPTQEMQAMGWAYHSEIGRMELPAAYTRMIDAALGENK